MIFKNQDIGKEVTIDLDTYFYYFVRPSEEASKEEKQGITLKTVRERLRRLYPCIGSEPIVAYYRRSSNDHVHVKMRFLRDLSVLDGFMVRAWMLDDQTRLSLDLARYTISGSLHEMNRCFDEKATLDGTKKAGPWIPLGYDRDLFLTINEMREDWIEYLTRWNRDAQQKQLGFL